MTRPAGGSDHELLLLYLGLTGEAVESFDGWLRAGQSFPDGLDREVAASALRLEVTLRRFRKTLTDFGVTMPGMRIVDGRESGRRPVAP